MTKKYKCRVEYLESDSTAYIDTGVSGANNNLKIEMGFSYSKFTAYGYFFSNYESETANVTRFCLNGTDTNWGLAYINTKSQDGAIYTSNFTKDTFNTFVLTKTSVSIDESTRTNDNPPSGTANTKNIILFNRGSGTYYEKRDIGMRCYYFRIYDNDVLVRDMIPVLDNSGRPAMYDQVSGQLFYNQGTGEFTYGRQIIPVEYLESTGTQYIDTGLKGKNGYDFDYKFNSTRIDGTAYGIGGEWENGKSCYLGLIRDTNYFGYHYQNTNSAIQVQLLTANTDYRVQAHLYSGEQYYILNGTKSAVGTITGTFTSTSNMRLFSVYSATPLYSYVKMYYCKIWDNGVLVRDFIPCIDENLVPFMFDLVTNTCYLNAGTGQFKVGPNVEKAWGGKRLRRKLALALANLKKPRKYYCEVEYLKSDGLSLMYITPDLSYFPDFEVGVKCDSNSDRNATLGVDGNNMLERSSASKPYWTLHASGTTFVSNVGVGTYADTKYKDGVFSVNGVTVGTKENTFQSGTLCLFKPHAGNNNTYKMSIYFFKAWDSSGNLVRDLIPVLDWNYVPCMYDRVTEQLFYNAGTGEFSYGREIHYVDYLESTGTQYIDTGYYPNLNTKVEFMASGISADSFAASSSGTWFTGGRQAYQQKMFGSHYNPSNQNLYFSFSTSQNSSYYSSSSMYGDNKKFTLDKTGLYINDVKIVNNTNTTDFTSPATLAIFALNNNGTVISFTGYKLQYYKIWDNNTLVRDYIPAIDENGVGYMLDRVSHTIYDNAGTGAFGYSAREVEYLESDGARAIVAGVTVDDTCGYDVKWMALNANDTIIMGTKGSGDSRWVLSGNNNPNVNLSWNKSYGSAGLGLNKIQTAQMNYLNDRKRILNDTPLTDITETLLPAASTYNVGIFGGYWGASSIGLYSTCRIYYAKISKGTGLIRDFVPMVKDGSPCLFDKIGGLYYFGTGTGTFTRGKIVEPEYE